MTTYLSGDLFKRTPHINSESIGWSDEKGAALRDAAEKASDNYYKDMQTAANYAEAYEKKRKAVDSFLSKGEPHLKSL